MNAVNTPPDWSAASFEGNEREQLRRSAKMSFTEKVRWLEEADRLSRKFEAARNLMRAQAPVSRNA